MKNALKSAWSWVKSGIRSARVEAWLIAILGIILAVVLFEESWEWKLAFAIGCILVGALIAVTIGNFRRNENIRNSIRESYEQHLKTSVSHLVSCLRHVVEALRKSGAIGRIAATHLEECTMRGLESDRQRFESLLKKRDKWVRPTALPERLGEFLRNYHWAVITLADGAAAAGYSFDNDGNYREWKNYDSALWDDIRRLVIVDGCDRLAHATGFRGGPGESQDRFIQGRLQRT